MMSGLAASRMVRAGGRAGVWVVALAIAASTALAAERPVLVLNDAFDPPFTTPQRTGFLDVVANEVFRRAGVELHLVKLPPERGLTNANAGIDDGELSRIGGLESAYPNLVRVPEKTYDLEFVALTRRAELSQASWQALEPHTVGYIKGWKIFEQNLPSQTSILTTEGPEQLLRLLGRDRVDVALYERWMGLALARTMGLADVRVVEPPLAVREMFIYLHKRHELLVPRIAEALRAVKREGFYDRAHRDMRNSLRSPAAP